MYVVCCDQSLGTKNDKISSIYACTVSKFKYWWDGKSYCKYFCYTWKCPKCYCKCFKKCLLSEISSLSQLAIQNHWALDYLLVSQGGICILLKPPCFCTNGSKQIEYHIKIIQWQVRTFQQIAQEQLLLEGLPADWFWPWSWLPDYGTRPHCILLIITLVIAVGIMLFCAVSYFKYLSISIAKINVLHSHHPSDEQPSDSTQPIGAMGSSLWTRC